MCDMRDIVFKLSWESHTHRRVAGYRGYAAISVRKSLAAGYGKSRICRFIGEFFYWGTLIVLSTNV